VKRHAKPTPWPVVIVAMIAAVVSGLSAGLIAAYPAISMTSSLLTENIRLAEPAAWFKAKWADTPPLDYGTGQW
jgi:hypothetical protein